MQRKYKLWDRENKKIYDLGYLTDCLYTTSFEEDFGNDLTRYEVLESTGFKDKNKKEIYTGDLFGKLGGDTERPLEYEIHAIVYFDTDLGAYCIDDNRGGWEYLSNYLSKLGNERDIIGNIYENAELLK